MSDQNAGNGELLGCPFCGGTEMRTSKPTCTDKTPYNPADRFYPVIRCRCGVEVSGKNDDYSDDSITARQAWNTRALSPSSAHPAQGLVKALEAAQAFDRLASYGKFFHAGAGGPGTLFEFSGDRWFFLSEDDSKAIRAALSAQGKDDGWPGAEEVDCAHTMTRTASAGHLMCCDCGRTLDTHPNRED